MARYWQKLRKLLTPSHAWRSLKYVSVGSTGTVLNLVLFTLFSLALDWPAFIITGMVFVLCGVYVFMGHALVTWRDTPGRKLFRTWLWFLAGNVTGTVINTSVLLLLRTLGAPIWVAWPIAMLLSGGPTAIYNAMVVFPEESLYKERIVRVLEKLVEWNKR